MAPQPLIIDCDPGIDDAIAILLALASPELDVLAITTVAGNVPLANTTANGLRVLDLVGRADGVQIFIGAQNELFGMAGCSMVVAPFQNAREQIVGAIGVIGPTRLNYARIIPMVDYTAKLVGRILDR